MQPVKATAQSPSASGTQSATIPISAGTYEILAVSASIGGTEAILAVVPVVMYGNVVFESEGHTAGTTQDLAISDVLASGISTEISRISGQVPKVIVGPGQIKSYMQHQEGFEHSIVVTYRRLHV